MLRSILIHCRHGRRGSRTLLRRLHRSERGGLLPATGAAIIAIISMAGVAIDSGRMIYVKDVLQRSLDAAGLAAGNAKSVADIQTDAQAFFDANFQAAGNLASSGDLDISVSDDNKTISLTANATVDATFARIIGFETLAVSAATEIERETRGMELVLVMDNTGSMRSNGKIDAMKNAARNLVNIVYGGEEEEVVQNLYVGLVPFTAMVNIGPQYDAWLTTSDQTALETGKFDPTDWKGCVQARTGGYDQNDATPAQRPFELFFWEDASDNDWRSGSPGDYDYDIDETNAAANAGTGPNLGCGPAITPLVAPQSTVQTAIDEMQAWSRGGTTSNLGLVWGWRVLSPDWRGLWINEDPTILPLDYDTPFMNKVVVVLTDGQNQFFDYGASGPAGSDETAYGRLHDFGFSTLGSARAEIDERFADICSDMKSNDIIIYSITFGNTPNASTQALYQNCASNPGFYFHAPSNSDLDDAFDAIGRQLSNLRLSQ